jgi:hypothetical protein
VAASSPSVQLPTIQLPSLVLPTMQVLTNLFKSTSSYFSVVNTVVNWIIGAVK